MKIKKPTILKLLHHLPNKGEAVIWITITSILTNFLSLVIPLYFMHVYDKIIPNSSIHTLIIITLGAIVIILIDTLFIIGRGVISSWLAAKFAFNEGTSLMKNLFGFTNKEYYSSPLTDYTESFRSIEKIKKVYSGQLFKSIIDIPFIFIFLYAIYYISGKLVLFHIFVLSIFIIFNFVYHFLFLKIKLDKEQKNTKRFDFLENILERIHPLKSQGFEDMLLRKLELVQKDYSESSFVQKTIAGIPTSVGELISQLMIYGTIVIGGIMALQGDITLGVISAATMLSRRTVGPLLSISRLSLTLSDSEIDFTKLEKFKRSNVSVNNTYDIPGNLEGYLELRNINLKKVDTSFGNLKDINLLAEKGEITGIICDDFSAASIFVDVIFGIEKPDSGKVILDSLILSDLNTALDIEEMVVIPRKTELFIGSILENITLFKSHLNAQALDVATFLGLNDIISNFPNGYETEVNPFSDKILPQVLINKISIARAILTRPRVIIVNQADTNMNNETRIFFMDILKKLSNNSAIIVISENRDFLMNSDNLYHLQNSTLQKVEEHI